MTSGGWRILASVASVVAVASIVGLIACLALGASDALATTALTLAILAFLVQLMVAAQQARAISQADSENRRLNHQTATLLEKIQTSAEASERVLVKQFENLLDFVMKGKTGGDDSGDKGSLAEAEYLMPPYTQQLASSEDQRIIDQFHEWPPVDEARAALELLRGFPPPSIAMLERYRKDEINSRKRGAAVGLHASQDIGLKANFRVLVEAGLLEPGQAGAMSRLTEKGRKVCSVLSAKGTPHEKVVAVYDWIDPEVDGPSEPESAP